MSLNSILIKPAGPDCNLRCNYCFYRQKSGIYPQSKEHRMKPAVLEKLISEVMQSDSIRPCFAWQGGEPTLMGLDFFKRAIELQIKYGKPGQSVSNSLMTNGVLLDSQWARFLAEYCFLVGISLDGPSEFHDFYRKDEKRRPTHRRVMDAVRLLSDHNVSFNALVLLNDKNVKEPDAVYDFLVGNGIFFLQFVPCVEPGGKGIPAAFSITPTEYGRFLCKTFDRWADDFPNVSVRDFDDLLAKYTGQLSGTCTHNEFCGDYLVVEHNGDVYPCDFFVQPSLKLGNITEMPLAEIAQLPAFKTFAENKSRFDLNAPCLKCEWLKFCNGGCQKHRAVLHPEKSVSGPSYFCQAYKMLFKHASHRLGSLAEKLKTLQEVFSGPY